MIDKNKLEISNDFIKITYDEFRKKFKRFHKNNTETFYDYVINTTGFGFNL